MDAIEKQILEFFEAVYDFPKNDRAMYRYAKRKHDETGAVRKGSGEPYFVHPEAVAKIAIAYGGDDLEIKAALAHDTIEDTGATESDIKEKFGEDVANIVMEITNDPYRVKELGKELYISLELSSISKKALFVKLCDMLHNTLDNCRPEVRDRMKKNIDYLISHRKDLGSREWELVDSIMENMSGDR